jgi:hypothetical protein
MNDGRTLEKLHDLVEDVMKVSKPKSAAVGETQPPKIKKLFLDDIRKAPDSSWHVVRSYQEFVDWILSNGCPEVVSFDHDLADAHYPTTEAQLSEDIDYDRYAERTGFHAAQWLIASGHTPKLIIVHSYNPVGARNIAKLFREGKAVVEPYPSPISLTFVKWLEEREGRA